MRYANLYFDTDELLCYRQHHNGQLTRAKVRYRHYVDSGEHYWEIKIKSNPRHTKKTRFPLEASACVMTEQLARATQEALPPASALRADLLRPRLWVTFVRMAFVARDDTERLTIDSNMIFKDLAGYEVALDDIIVAELKQPRLSLRAPFVQLARERKIYPQPFSKYCTGVAMMLQPTKMNRLKRRLRSLPMKGAVPCISKP